MREKVAPKPNHDWENKLYYEQADNCSKYRICKNHQNKSTFSIFMNIFVIWALETMKNCIDMQGNKKKYFFCRAVLLFIIMNTRPWGKVGKQLRSV